MKFPSPLASLLPRYLKHRCRSSDGSAVREALCSSESLYYPHLTVAAENCHQSLSALQVCWKESYAFILCFRQRAAIKAFLGVILTGNCFVLVKLFVILMAPVLRTVTTPLQMLCLSYVSLEPLILVNQAVPRLLGDPEPLDY